LAGGVLPSLGVGTSPGYLKDDLGRLSPFAPVLAIELAAAREQLLDPVTVPSRLSEPMEDVRT